MNFVKIEKIENGATMIGGDGETYGNTCFFNCFLEGLKVIGINNINGFKLETLNLHMLLGFGGWPIHKAGKMVEVNGTQGDDTSNIELLCKAAKVRVKIYTEIPRLNPYNTNEVLCEEPCFVWSDTFTVFGERGPVIKMVLLRGCPHFNLMEFESHKKELQELEDQLIVMKMTLHPVKFVACLNMTSLMLDNIKRAMLDDEGFEKISSQIAEEKWRRKVILFNIERKGLI